MRRNSIFGITALLALSFIFTACGAAANGTPTEAPEMIFTRVAETVFYSVTQTAEAIPTLTPTPILPTPTATIIVLPTIQSTISTILPTVGVTQSVSTGTHSGDYAQFLYNSPSDPVTVARGSEFSEAIGFLNIGSTTWSTKYTLRFYGGVQMSGVTSVALTKAVKPGERAEIIIAGIAPVTKGTYLNRWALYTDSGLYISGSEMYIKIVVP
jgi:hypothetical protein